MVYEEIAVYRRRRWDFHIYHDKETNTLKYKINDDPNLAYNKLEYLEGHKILRIKNRYRRSAGLRYKDINIRFKGKRIFGIFIENAIIHKILVGALNGDDYSDKAKLYTYENYLKHNEMINSRRGIVVKKCDLCDDAILLGSVSGRKVGSFSMFMSVRAAMRKSRADAGRKDVGFCYAVSEKYYFISTPNKGFICRQCLTGRLYRTGYYAQV